jgi:beta-lactamase superfamily II metal-dependent hydrolase
MEDLISRLDEQNENTVRRILLDQYSDDLEFDLGYGLFSYYFLRALKRRNRKACICFLLFYVLFFGFQMKFFIIIADLLFDRFEIRKDERLSYKVMFFMILNKKLLQNRSILLPLLFESYGLFEFPFDFKTYLMVTASIFFGQSDLIDILFFDFFLKGRILLFCFSIFSALIPFMQVPFMYLARAYSYVNSLHINIRGCISVPTFLLFLELKKLIRNQNSLIELLAISFCILLPLYEPFFQVSFLNVGQGDSILITYPFSHSCILIDTGPPYNYHLLQRELFRKGIYVIDHLIITHDDSDHNGNIGSLYEDFKVKDIVTEGRDISYKTIMLEYIDLGHFDNDNDNSLVYRLDVNGYDFLFTGDISSYAERVLIRRFGPIKTDFLKVSHHGSRSASSDYFISHLLPEMAVISTSGLYGHPHQEVLDTLDRYHISYYLTSRSGSISVFISSLFSFIKTAKNEFVIMR